MTVDIARMDSNAVAVLSGANEALARLGEWVHAAASARVLVASLIDTAFVPDAYKPRVDPRATDKQKAEAREIAINNGTAAVLQGVTLGIDPLMAMQQIYIIHGRPGMYAKMMVALVQAHGHEVWTEDQSDTRAAVCGRRKGSEHVERITITMDMARKAKWTTNTKYQETPQDMLWARAAGRVCDRIASDVLKGIASVEQIQDEVFSTTAEVGSNGHRTVAPRKRPPAIESIVEEPPLDEGGQAETPAAPEPAAQRQDEPRASDSSAPETTGPPAAASITPAQQKLLHALLRDKGKADRDIALVYIAAIIGREIESTKELDKKEATDVIDALRRQAVHVEEPTLDEDWPQVAGEAG